MFLQISGFQQHIKSFNTQWAFRHYLDVEITVRYAAAVIFSKKNVISAFEQIKIVKKLIHLYWKRIYNYSILQLNFLTDS